MATEMSSLKQTQMERADSVSTELDQITTDLNGLKQTVARMEDSDSVSTKLDQITTDLKQIVARMEDPVVSAFTVSEAAVMRTSTIIRFTNVMYDAGSDYNTSTGYFTCRHPGIYSFTLTLTVRIHSDGHEQCTLYKNSAEIMTVSITFDGRDVMEFETPISGSATVHLNRGDTISVAECQSDNIISLTEFLLTGFLISSD